MANDSRDTGAGHPVLAAVARSEAEICAVAQTPTWSMRPAETREALRRLARRRAMDDELEARLIREGEANGAFTETGAVSAAAWLAHATRMTHREARRRAKLAHTLVDHHQVNDAMADGQVLPDQATVICQAVEVLPDQPGLRELCEKELVGLAEHHDAQELKDQGRKVLAIVDPDAADAHEAALLEREEKDAAKATSFSMWETGDGKVRGKFTISALTGAMLRKALTSIAAPKHVRATDGSGSYDHERPTAERLGQAFTEYVSRYPADKLPHAGGTNATVVVTMELSTLLGGLKAASIDTGGHLSPGEARRLACEAGIIPAVLDGRSRVLDLGYKRRFHDEGQRVALAITQKHCQHPTCKTPAWLCHVHHPTPWSKGGRTDLANAELRCPRHHALAHRSPPAPPART